MSEEDSENYQQESEEHEEGEHTSNETQEGPSKNTDS